MKLNKAVWKVAFTALGFLVGLAISVWIFFPFDVMQANIDGIGMRIMSGILCIAGAAAGALCALEI